MSIQGYKHTQRDITVSSGKSITYVEAPGVWVQQWQATLESPAYKQQLYMQ